MELALALHMPVSDLKAKLTVDDAIKWGLYRKKHGPLDIQQRMEYGFALLAGIQTGERDLKKFIPWREPPELTPEMMFAQIKGASRKNGK